MNTFLTNNRSSMWIQKKYNGVGFRAGLNDGHVVLYTEDYTDIKHLDSIRTSLLPIMTSIKKRYPDGVCDIVGVLTINGGVNQLRESIYDVIIDKYTPDTKVTALILDILLPGSYSDRWTILSEYISVDSILDVPLQLVDNMIHYNLGSVRREHIGIVRYGYEGTVIIDPTSIYTNIQEGDMILGKTISPECTIIENVRELRLQKVDDYMRVLSILPDTILDCIPIDILVKLLPSSGTSIRHIDIRFPLDATQNLEQWDIIDHKSMSIRIAIHSYSYTSLDHKLIIRAEILE